MKRVLALAAVLAFSVVAVMASPVDQQRAMRIAQSFLQQRGMASEKLTNVVDADEFTLLYVFGGDNCFVVVPADDVARPVLGYSLRNAFPSSNAMPANLRGWLHDYETQIADARANGLTPSKATLDQWESIEKHYAAKYSKEGSVAPLLFTTWDQAPYYNALCPYDEQHDARTVTGCVATAMAQIMRYWEYPSRGMGSNSYNTRFGLLSADFSSVSYDWDNMPSALRSTSSDEQMEAVSTLMWHCGVAVKMDYGVSAEGGSGAQIYDMIYAMQNYFGYYGLNSAFLSSTTIEQWEARLKSEIDDGRPVYYIGGGSGGNHAWVCDGYNEDMQFHMNWGWGGFADGYYAIGALAPGPGGIGSGLAGEYNNGNMIVYNFMPPADLRVANREVSMRVNGGSKTVRVYPSSSANDWRATTNVSWLALDNASGQGNAMPATLVLKADTNTTGAPRYATVTISQGGNGTDFTVMQHGCGATAQLPFNEGFESFTADCWRTETVGGTADSNFGVLPVQAYAKKGEYAVQFAYNESEPDRRQYLISPEFTMTEKATLSFFYKREWSYNEHFVVLYSATDDDIESFIYYLGEGGMSDTGWHQFVASVPAEARYIAVCYGNRGFAGRNWVIDELRLEVAEDGCDAIDAMPYEQGFEDGLECWRTLSRNMANMSLFGVAKSNNARTGRYLMRFASSKTAADYNQYLISPRVASSGDVDFSFYYRRNGNAAERFVPLYSVTGSTPECFVPLSDTVNVLDNEWVEYSATLPDGTRYVAIHYCTEAGSYIYIDDISITSDNGGGPSGIANVDADDVRLSTLGRSIVVGGCAGDAVKVFDVRGLLVASCAAAGGDVRLAMPAAGVYVVQIGQMVRKVVVF